MKPSNTRIEVVKSKIFTHDPVPYGQTAGMLPFYVKAHTE